MTLSIIVTTLLNTFATSPDLCADVYVDAAGQPYTDAAGLTLSRTCEWAGPDAPVLDADVCCAVDEAGAVCTWPDANGRCAVGSLMYCEYGEGSTAGVVCYQPFPSTCDLGFCVDEVAPPSGGPVENLLCCWGDGICFEIGVGEGGDCLDGGGYISWCFNGALNQDGTVDCFD